MKFVFFLARDIKREADTLVTPEINLEPPSQSHDQTRQQPHRSQRVSKERGLE